MSDDEDFFMDDDGGGGEEDIDEGNDGVQVENLYYEAKELSRDDPEAGVEGFENVLAMEDEKGKWGFKSLKRLVMINHQLGNHQKVLSRFKELLTYTKKAIPINESEKPINSLLDYCNTSPSIREIYDSTLDAFKEAKNEKAQVRLQLRMAKVLLEKKDYSRLERSLKELRENCQNDVSKASQLMEVLALEILMHSERGNVRQLKALYDKANDIKAAINVPSITAIINECGGKMYMREKRWDLAYRDLFQAFKDYDEVGNKKALQCLKYLVLASMLASLDVDPFNDTRAKAFKNKEEIQAFVNLISAYQNREIRQFEMILKQNQKTITEDEFMMHYIQDLLTNIRRHFMVKLIKPYTCISLQFIGKEMNITSKDVEDLLVSMILDKMISGSIDQVNQMLHLNPAKSTLESKYNSISRWADQLKNVNLSIAAKVH